MVTTDSSEIWRIDREHLKKCIQADTYHLESPEEINTFLDTYDLIKSNQEHINHLKQIHNS